MASSKTIHQDVPTESILWDIVESVNDAVITIDEDHKIVICNRAAEEMFGYRREELIGRDAAPVIPAPHQAVHRQYVERYIETEIPRVIGQTRECFGLRKDGSTFPVEISYSVSKTKGRLFFTAVIRDISERKSRDREVRFLERLADVGKSVAQVAHEIRKPLMLIGGFARQVEQCAALQGNEKNRQKLNIIVEEVSRLEKILNGVSLLTRPSASSRKSTLALNGLLKECSDLIEPLLKDRNIQLELELTEDPLDTLGDPDQLKQVFLNLLYNAVESIEEEGKIRVTSRREGREAVVTIEDNGHGISDDLKQKIFDPFFTTKSKGTGLGLAISKNIIREHEGLLTLDSEVGKGTTFSIRLPLHD